MNALDPPEKNVVPSQILTYNYKILKMYCINFVAICYSSCINICVHIVAFVCTGSLYKCTTYIGNIAFNATCIEWQEDRSR